MPTLALSLLGPFQATLDDRPITTFESNKVRALLTYLAVEADRPHSRDELIGLLWSDRPEAVARANLRQALANLRRALYDRGPEPVFLTITADGIQFRRSSQHWIDATALLTLLAECRTHPHERLELCHTCAQRLRQATALYRTEFLASFLPGRSEAFEEWARMKSARLHLAVLEALRALTAYHLQQADGTQAQQYALRQLELDPWCEEAHQQMMQALALAGQRSAALVQYKTCRRILADELGAEPAYETTLLYDRIKKDTLEARASLLLHLPQAGRLRRTLDVV